ncbi:hypothetical protein [Oceanibacterium hippocampi]|uniref:Uncharacterized protein n=1 Tax=Oceanibacterium hippocampi TaxID=745714 RepID=A0A1Y5U0C4_9PROT|nr:hypothetical protein [Oceanibacterium hippocampi]SLN73393.1 hypothetical protein OCH7691_03600 [Oceanibacterium hippocampi]
MSSQKFSFEVLAQSGTNWTLVNTLRDKEAAIADAKARRTQGRFKAVRVVKTSFDETENIFKETEVFFEGDKRKASKHDDEDAGVACWKPDDFYSITGRDSIRRYLKESLDRWGIIPLELLHHIEHFERLEDTGTIMQGAVQRAAIAQARESGQDLRKRMLEIYNLINAAADILRKDFKKGDLKKLQGDDINGLVDALAGDSRRGYLFQCAMAIELFEIKGVRTKLNRVLSLFARCDRKEAYPFFDMLLAEFFDGMSNLSELFGQEGELGTAVLGLADIAIGKGRTDEGGGEMLPGITQLAERIADGGMNHTRDALLGRVYAALRGKKEMRAGVVDDILFNSEMLDRLRLDDGEYAGGEKLMEVLKERSERLITAFAIERLLGECENPAQRAERLLQIEPGIVGGTNKRTLAGYIKPLIGSADNEIFFVKENGNVFDRLRWLCRAEAAVVDSGFDELNRRHLCDRLDEIAVKILASEKLLARLEGKGDNFVETGLALLRFCASGLLTDGNAKRMAKQRTLVYLKKPGFLSGLMGSYDGEAAMAQGLKEFQGLLAAAKIDAS